MTIADDDSIVAESLAGRLLARAAHAVVRGGRTRAVVASGPPPERARGVLAAPAYRAEARAWRAIEAFRFALAPPAARRAEPAIDVASWLPAGCAGWKPRVVLVGTPGPARTVVALLADAQGRDRAALKVAAAPAAGEALEREANALRDPSTRGIAPTLLKLGDLAGRPALLTSFVRGRPAHANGDVVRRLVRILPTASERGSALAMERALLRSLARNSGLDPDRLARALPGARPLIRSHGDLAPWNVLDTGHGGLALVDWEESRSDGLAGLDLVQYLLSAEVLLRRRRSDRAAEAVIATMQSAAAHDRAEAAALTVFGAEDLARRERRDGGDPSTVAAWHDVARAAAARLPP